MAAEEVPVAPDSFDKDELPTVVFMIGRMNPPTPGHVKLAEEVLDTAREKKGIPRIYLTQSVNPPDIGPRIHYVTNDPIHKLSSKNKRSADGTFTLKTPLYVKHPKAQNPLDVDLKKRFLIDMLVHRKLGSEEEKQAFRHDLDKIVVTNCARRGPISAMWCAAMEQLNWPSQEDYDPNNIDPSKLIYVMGGEVNPHEAANREKNCANIDNGPANWEERRLTCKIIQRTNDDSSPEEVNLESMSGSKVRLLVGCKQQDREQARATFDQVYANYLSDQQKNDLYNAIQNGLFGFTDCPTLPERNIKQKAGTNKRRHGKLRKSLKKNKRTIKKISSRKAYRNNRHKRNNRPKRNTKRIGKLHKPNFRNRYSTRRKR